MKQRNNNKKRPAFRQPDFSEKKQKRSRPPELYDNADMMQFFKVSGRTLQRWRDEKILPFKKIGGKIYYLSHEVHELMNRQSE